MLVNADSHTCSAGAFNCAARGVGGPDMLYAVTTGKAWFRVGETIRYDLTGQLRPGVSAKDIFLTIAGKWGAHVNQNVEYGGPGMASMSLNARRTLTTMGTELSAEFVIFEPDDTLVEYVKARNPKPFTPTMPDADAAYKERRTIDLGTIEPLVALPDAVVNNSVGISEVAGRHIDQAFIGACCNGTLDDLAVAARVVQGRRVAAGTRFIVTPEHPGYPSRRARRRLCRNADGSRRDRDAGDLRRLRRRPYGRAWPQRSVHHRQHAQLQGPHGRSLGAHLHGLACHGGRLRARRPDRQRRRVLPGRRVMRSGRVWKFGDNINTDLMLPGRCCISSPEQQARAVFMNNRPGWVDQVQKGDVIVGGFNYGMGSSRPAARSLRNCGVGLPAGRDDQRPVLPQRGELRAAGMRMQRRVDSLR